MTHEPPGAVRRSDEPEMFSISLGEGRAITAYGKGAEQAVREEVERRKRDDAS